MNVKPESIECQIHCVPQLAQPIHAMEKANKFFSRIRRFAKRRAIFIENWLLRNIFQKNKNNTNNAVHEITQIAHLQAGDLVRVKSKEEIRSTLNNWNSINGCAFLEEMWPYCGTTHRIMKRVERFLDERDYQMKKTKGVVLLEGVICNGTVDFGKCDRSCFFFWREEWLEKIG